MLKQRQIPEWRERTVRRQGHYRAGGIHDAVEVTAEAQQAAFPVRAEIGVTNAAASHTRSHLRRQRQAVRGNQDRLEQNGNQRQRHHAERAGRAVLPHSGRISQTEPATSIVDRGERGR